jgi:hypothetical protein
MVGQCLREDLLKTPPQSLLGANVKLFTLVDVKQETIGLRLL